MQRGIITYILFDLSIVEELKKVVSNILVAVDGSNNSFRAADAAMKLAGDYGAKLFVVSDSYSREISCFTVRSIRVRRKTCGNGRCQEVV